MHRCKVLTKNIGRPSVGRLFEWHSPPLWCNEHRLNILQCKLLKAFIYTFYSDNRIKNQTVFSRTKPSYIIKFRGERKETGSAQEKNATWPTEPTRPNQPNMAIARVQSSLVTFTPRHHTIPEMSAELEESAWVKLHISPVRQTLRRNDRNQWRSP